MAAEAPAQGVEMSYQPNSAGGPPSSIGLANGDTHKKNGGKNRDNPSNMSYRLIQFEG